MFRNSSTLPRVLGGIVMTNHAEASNGSTKQVPSSKLTIAMEYPYVQ